MGLRRLHHFVTLIEQGSFARAATVLHLSQPALSRSIQGLEAEFGSQLLDRRYGKARPTASGSIVLERARRMLREGRELRRDLDLLRDVEMGEVRVGFGPFAAAFLMEPVLTALLARYPKLRIDIEIADTPSMAQKLKAEQLDFFVGESQSLKEQPQLRIERLRALETSFFVRRDHALAARGAIALTELLAFPVAGPRIPARVAEFFRGRIHAEAGEDARELLTVTCDDMHTLRTLILNTDAAGLVPRAMMSAEEASGTLVPLQVTPAIDLKAAYGLVSLAGRSLSPAAQALVALVHQILPGHPALDDEPRADNPLPSQTAAP
ncbi:transcriptional regulator [Cupriavidus sp. SK-3]|uniref:LysR family transcriptional regulator n=1 Tax=Cupriavidus sp. SK-3 TaxID=1470558 RepID=UPI0004518ED0|nr:LysR family transcriptional regulator [Cupriavidus sp. SK-3]KDP89168.1 transcriptional regulator [Cupriavidus sp. SK-3]